MKSVWGVLGAGAALAAAVTAAKVLVDVSPSKTKIANPWKYDLSKQEAESLAGIKGNFPQIQGYDVTYAAMKDILEADYEGEYGKILIRKSKNLKNPSGDYNIYDFSETVTMFGIPVKVLGNKGKMNLCFWENNGYGYSISVNIGTDKGLAEEEIIHLAENVY